MAMVRVRASVRKSKSGRSVRVKPYIRQSRGRKSFLRTAGARSFRSRATVNAQRQGASKHNTQPQGRLGFVRGHRIAPLRQHAQLRDAPGETHQAIKMWNRLDRVHGPAAQPKSFTPGRRQRAAQKKQRTASSRARRRKRGGR